MNRVEFLDQNDGFVRWLGSNLSTQVFNLNMLPSRFVPGGLKKVVTGLPNLLLNYIWRSSWNNPDTKLPVVSQDWQSTVASLGMLRQWVARALAGYDQQDVFDACREVLRWGGVRGAIPFLKHLKEENLLVDYLTTLAPLMKLDNDPSQILRDLNQNSIRRFDAGLTKIHALIDVSGSSIYDSRVGAAMAMLYALYKAGHKNAHGAELLLKFPSGPARGNQIRDPGKLGYGNAPQFFTKAVTGEEWGRWQVRLGWILRAVLDKNEWFSDEGNIVARCHAFEACLFMIGYDLRCFNGDDGGVSIGDGNSDGNGGAAKVNEPAKKGWVPSGHPFDNVIGLYFDYRNKTDDHSKEGFHNWLVENIGIQITTAKSYCFPFRENEFDLFGRDITELKAVVDGGRDGLYAALGTSEPYAATDERECVCLVDAWIAGRAESFSAKDQGPYNARLVRAEFAGTCYAANTLLSVGRNVGKHFGLLDQDNKPTPFYVEFFGNGMDVLEQRLQNGNPG